MLTRNSHPPCNRHLLCYFYFSAYANPLAHRAMVQDVKAYMRDTTELDAVREIKRLKKTIEDKRKAERESIKGQLEGECGMGTGMLEICRLVPRCAHDLSIAPPVTPALRPDRLFTETDLQRQLSLISANSERGIADWRTPSQHAAEMERLNTEKFALAKANDELQRALERLEQSKREEEERIEAIEAENPAEEGDADMNA